MTDINKVFEEAQKLKWEMEALARESYPEVNCWIWTRLEHDRNDYYLVEHHDVCMDSLTVRVRERRCEYGSNHLLFM